MTKSTQYKIFPSMPKTDVEIRRDSGNPRGAASLFSFPTRSSIDHNHRKTFATGRSDEGDENGTQSFKATSPAHSAGLSKSLERENNMLRRMVQNQERAIKVLSESTTPITELINNVDVDNTTRAWLNLEFGGESRPQQVHPDTERRGSVVHKHSSMIEGQGSVGGISTDQRLDFDMNSWNFDVWEIKGPSKFVELSVNIFDDYELDTRLTIDPVILRRFIERSFDGYFDTNPYHNKWHAFDVLQAASVCLSNVPQGLLTHTDILAVLVSALLHDIIHPGTSNAFQVNSQSEATLIYNDAAVLEAQSLSYSFRKVLSQPDSEILKNLSPDSYRYVRKTIVLCVLATDMAKHFEMVTKLEEMTTGTFSGSQGLMPETKMILLEAVVHAADISNVCKPLPISIQWAVRVAEEFQAQGEKEVELNLPVNPYGAKDTKRPEVRMCINFIDFVAGPLWVSLTRHLSTLNEPIAHLIQNRHHWMVEMELLLKEENTTASKSELSQLKRRTLAFHDLFGEEDFNEHLPDDFGDGGDENANHDTLDPTSADGRPAVPRQKRPSIVGIFMNQIEKEVKKPTGVSFPNGKSSSQALGRNRPETVREESEYEHDNRNSLEETDAPMDDLPIKRVPGLSLIAPPRKAVQEHLTHNQDIDSSPFTATIVSILDSKTVGVLLVMLTIFVLFGDDVRLAWMPPESDQAFGILAFFSLFVFTGEALAQCWVYPSFRFNFFFWLDVVAIVSLLPDIPWIWDAFTSEADTSGIEITRAGRASRAGARAGRVVRIIRMVRLLRILKFYEMFNRQQARNGRQRLNSRRVTGVLTKHKKTKSRPATEISVVVEDAVPPESKVGAKLADMTTRRVIFIVLAMLFTMPFLEYQEIDYSPEVGLGLVHMASMRNRYGNLSDTVFHDTINDYIRGTPSLLQLQVDTHSLTDDIYGSDEIVDTFRGDEVVVQVQTCITAESCATNMTLEAEIPALDADGDVQVTVGVFCTCYTNETSFAVYNIKQASVSQAVAGIGLTLFIIALLGTGTMLFSHDAHTLVIAPIENMVKIVQDLAMNPLTKFEDDYSTHTNAGYETVLLENCIKKIGGLLQVGFGEAGAEIIAANMNGEGELDPMIPGKIVRAIFGFCDIRNFTDVTEILKTEVMMFVNEIANIVHGQVCSYGGSANKNIGDAFLLVWKLSSRDGGQPTTIKGNEADNARDLKPPPRSTADIDKEKKGWHKLADKALISFLKTIVEINRSTVLNKYSDPNHEVGKQLLKAMPGYRVHMGFGLHIGWAVEGAIGSDQKIDASYLSPHVNLSSRLEAATKQYGVDLLMSGQFHKLLSIDGKKCCRKLDVVTVKGSALPMSIYTYDCVTKDLLNKLKTIRLKGTIEFEEEDRRISIIGPAPVIDHYHNSNTVDNSTFRTDLELRALQWEIPPHFLPLFRKAIGTYLSGKWQEARKLFEATLKMLEGEKNGPSRTILDFMAKTNYTAPADWKGYRALTDK